MHSRRSLYSFILALLFVSVACGQPRTGSETRRDRDTRGPGPATGTVTDKKYRLVHNDTVAINVVGRNEFMTEQRIDDRGIVRLWLLEEVPLAGKTIREAETYLEKLYVEKRLLRKPWVQISVRGYDPREIFLTGAVNSPGVHQLTGDESSIELKKLILSRGGLQTKADGSSVKIIRAGTSESISVNVNDLLKGKGPDSFLIYAGDTIHVPLKWF
jgi:protein involved in polysaccharide export with SLBB domain